MIEMATARPPWPESETQMGVLWQIASSSRGPTPPETLSEVGRDMLFQCFKRHPNERITAHQMLAHEYLRHEQVPLDDDALQLRGCVLERVVVQGHLFVPQILVREHLVSGDALIRMALEAL